MKSQYLSPRFKGPGLSDSKMRVSGSSPLSQLPSSPQQQKILARLAGLTGPNSVSMQQLGGG